MKTIQEYAIALCEFEMLEKISGEYFKKYFFSSNCPPDIREEWEELESTKEKIVEQIKKFRENNKRSFEKLAADLNIIDGKIKAIEFVDIFDKVSIKLVEKSVKIDDYITDAYKRFDTSWKLCVKNFDIKAVKKYQTEELLNM